ncbi:MAG: LamG-like jellyroll fold domain-containing protein [Verrucomicrobiota bacterium]
MSSIMSKQWMVTILASLMALNTASGVLVFEMNFNDATGAQSAATTVPSSPAITPTLSATAGFSNTVVPSINGGGFAADLTDTSVTSGGTAPSFIVSDADAGAIDGLSVLTISMWINIDGSTTSNHRILRKSFDDILQIRTNNTIRFEIDGPGSGDSETIDSTLTVADNTWTFIAVSYDGTSSTNNLTFWTRAEGAGAFTSETQTLSSGLDWGSNNDDLFIGGPLAGTYAEAYLDNLRFHDTVLSETELNSLFTTVDVVPEPSTYSYIFLGFLILAAARQYGLRKNSTKTS